MEGRSAKAWVDYSLFGHQIVCHEVKGYNANSIHNAVDGDPVPVPHFGLALTPSQFHMLAEKVQKEGVEFVLAPHLRFKGIEIFLLLSHKTVVVQFSPTQDWNCKSLILGSVNPAEAFL